MNSINKDVRVTYDLSYLSVELARIIDSHYKTPGIKQFFLIPDSVSEYTIWLYVDNNGWKFNIDGNSYRYTDESDKLKFIISNEYDMHVDYSMESCISCNAHGIKFIQLLHK